MTKIAHAAIACVLLNTLVTGSTRAGVNQWTIDGPYGGPVRSILYVPGQNNVALAGAGNAIYRTTDNGQTWTPILDRLVSTVSRFSVDPGNPSRIIGIGPQGPVRSDDGGLTFGFTARFAANDGGESAFAMSGDGQVWYGGAFNGKVYRSTTQGLQWEDRSTGLPQGVVVSLVVHPQVADRVYAITSNAATAFMTLDGGLHWSALGGIDCTAVLCREIAIDPQDPTRLLLATGTGIHRSTDSGQTWSLQVMGHFFTVRFDPTTPNRVLAASTLDVFISDNAGQSWTARAPHRANIVNDLAFDPAHAGRIMLGTSDGVLQSEDAAGSWQVRSTGIRAAELNSLTAASDGTNRVFASGYAGPAGAFARDAATAQWTSLGRASMQSFFPSLFDVTVVRNDPVNHDTLYASASGAVLKSVDGGATWGKPSPQFDADFVNDLAIDPLNSQIVYAVTSTRGAFRSSNGGATWFPRSTGLTPTALSVLAMDPQDSQVIYAGSGSPTSLGVYKTIDAGLHWNAANTGIEAAHVMKLAIDGTNRQTLYAGTSTGLFKTSDGGGSWTGLPLPFLVADVVVDPVIATNIIRTPDPTGRNGVARSVDGGQTWETVELADTRPVTKLVLDPAQPSNLIAAIGQFGIGEIEFAPDVELSTTTTQFAVDAPQAVTAAIVNRGPYAASAVRLEVSAVTALTTASLSIDRGSCVRAGTSFVCSIGALRVNESATVSIANVRTTVPGETLSVSVTAHERDHVPLNNSLTLTSEAVTDVAASLSAAVTTAIEGAQLEYTLRVSNAGPSNANAVRVALQFPPAISFGQFTTANSGCSGSNPTLQCDIASLASGASVEIRFTAAASSAGQGNVTATASTSTRDPNAANNIGSVAVTVAAKTPAGGNNSGGGGGAMSWELAFLLSLLATLRRYWRCLWLRDETGY